MDNDFKGEDVTKKKGSRGAPFESSNLLRAVFDSPAVGIAVTDPDKAWVEVNDRVCAMLGYSRSELAGTTWEKLTHPDDIQSDVAQFDRLIAGEMDRYSLDKRFIRKDGSVLWALLSVTGVHGADGRIRYLVAILHDIGMRKEAEEAYRQAEARLVRVLDGSSDGFGDFDAATGCVSITPRYCEIYGLPEGTKEISVEALMAFVEPADVPPILADLEAIRTGEKDAHVWEFRIRRKDGSTRWLQSRGRVMRRDESGNPLHVSGATTDITERKRTEAERERLVLELRGAVEQVKTLSGIVPICSGCKKIRDDKGFWEQVEAYVSRHTDARFSHGICPDCMKRLFPED
jgi:PAS domain S-box-containing protein